MELKKNILTLVFIFTLLSTTFTMLLATDNPGGPGMDDYYAEFIPDPDTQVAKLRADKIQAIDVPYFDLVAPLRAEGFFVYRYPVSSVFEYYDINVGGYKHYRDDPNKWGHFPLNSTHFRRALAYVRNVESAMMTSPMLKGQTMRNRGWIGQFAGEWYNPNAEDFPYSPDSAIHEMFLGEFVPYDTAGKPISEPDAKANPAAIDHWKYEPTGTPIGPTGKIRTLQVYGCTSWPYYIDMAEAWCAGLDTIGISYTKYYAMWLWIWIKVSRGKFDIGVFGTAWSKKDPYIMDLYFHVDYQPKLPSNSPCCNWRFYNNSEVNALIDLYGTTLNKTEAVKAAHKVQEIIASDAIMPAAFTWNGYAAYNPDLMGIPRSMHIADRGLALFQSSWWDPAAKIPHANAIHTAWYEGPEDLNPAQQIGVAASWLLGAVIDGYGNGFGLTMQDPVTLETKPWIAWKWTEDTWQVEPGKLGTKITYYLRQDIYWHDGVQLTAEDIKFSLEYLRDHGHAAGQSKYATKYLVNVTVHDEWTATVYYNKTSLFFLTYTGFWATMLAKHIWERPECADPAAITPWTMDNPIPAAAVKGLTYLVGTGPFCYHKGDWVEGQYIRFRAASGDNVVGPGFYRSAEDSIADINLDFEVELEDAWYVTWYFGARQDVDIEYDILNGRIDINCNGRIDIYDIGLLIANYGKTW